MIYEFDDFQLDSERYEFRYKHQLRSIEPQVFDLLLLLLANHERIVTKDEIYTSIWKDRIVSEATLSSRINAARRALEDDGERQKFIKTIPRRGYRFIGNVEVHDPSIGKVSGARESTLSNSNSQTAAEFESTGEHLQDKLPRLQQQVQFHTTRQGVNLAYSVVGKGYPLVKAANWMNHLEYEIHNPPWSHWWNALSARYRLYRYDQRGNGLSDSKLQGLSFDSLVDDLESLIDAIGLDQFALLGVSQGCATSIAYAARNPERVSQLILYGGYVQGWRRRGTPEEVKRDSALITLIEQGWGQDNEAFRQLFTSMFMPDADPEFMAAFNELQRRSTTPKIAAQLVDVFGDIDVTGLLPKVSVPTLVLHCRNDARAPFDQGRALAAGIPDARFVPLESRNHILLPEDPAWVRFLQEVEAFID